MRISRWILGIEAALVLIGPSCAKTDGQFDDETHFQACKTQSDCADAGEAMVCTDGFCQPTAECTSTAECGSGEHCVTGRCLPDCATSGTCAAAHHANHDGSPPVALLVHQGHLAADIAGA